MKYIIKFIFLQGAGVKKMNVSLVDGKVSVGFCFFLVMDHLVTEIDFLNLLV